MKFNVGDRIECLVDNPASNPRLHVGSTGTIVHADHDEVIRVRWDLEQPDLNFFHSCGGYCEHGYGWNVFDEQVCLVEDSPDIDISADDLCDFLGVNM